MKRRSLFTMLLAPLTVEATPPQDVFYKDWQIFANNMNKYIEYLNKGENNLTALRTALKSWRRLEKDMGW